MSARLSQPGAFAGIDAGADAAEDDDGSGDERQAQQRARSGAARPPRRAAGAATAPPLPPAAAAAAAAPLPHPAGAGDWDHLGGGAPPSQPAATVGFVVPLPPVFDATSGGLRQGQPALPPQLRQALQLPKQQRSSRNWRVTARMPPHQVQ